MLGVIVCTHSDLASGLSAAANMIGGEQENFDVISFREGEDMMALSGKIKELAEHYESQNEKFVMLVDLFGATPFNASAVAMSESCASIITGVNLPLLLEILMGRSNMEDYDEFLNTALENTKESMKVVKMQEMFHS